jgi:DNA-binding transcriptional LysR family regulator
MTNELKIFVRAVQLKNISAAARSLHLSPAAASHRILQLENRIGARLLNRTTRNLQPTEEGQLFYEHALDVLSAIERAESSIASIGGSPVGALRVTAPWGSAAEFWHRCWSIFDGIFPKSSSACASRII